MSEGEGVELMTDADEETTGTVSEELGFSGPAEELAAINARMDQIKEEVTADLLATWPSPWKNESMVSAKVGGRLGSHKAFQLLLQRRRELDEELGTDSTSKPIESAEDPMQSYANKMARGEEVAGN
ncbi:MAG: hypothetical protein WD178_06750 [Actinomycetota bacterium]